jgi:nucleoside 2-deoxyribosyltransferase
MDYLIYLAGPITGLTWAEATEWRVEAAERFKDASSGKKHNYITLSPLRGKEYLKEETDIKHSYDDHQLSSAKMINSRDMFDVRRSSLLIVNLKNAKKVSIGTILEVGAAFILNKPIIVIMEPDEPWVGQAASGAISNGITHNVHKHSMLSEQATAIVSDLDTAIYFALQILG